MNFPRTSLEQWRVLQAIVEHGGFAQAASALNRSQSAVSYNVARLQEQLGVSLLEAEGRRMKLTAAGAALLREATPLIEAALRLETRARALDAGWEAEVRLAVDSLFPTDALLCALAGFAGHCPDTRLQVHEVVMSGADDALYAGAVELAIVTRVPSGFMGDWLMDATFVAVAAPGHPLLAAGHRLGDDDLRRYPQVVVRDSGTRQPRDEGWLGASQRWTVSSPHTALDVVSAGLAYGWLPEHRIRQPLAHGLLRPLPLAQGQQRKSSLYLVNAAAEAAGPATRYLAEGLRQAVQQHLQQQLQQIPSAQQNSDMA